MRTIPYVLVFSALLAGCSEMAMSDLDRGNTEGEVFDSLDEDGSRMLRLDVYPSDLDDPDQGVRYLPQTFAPGNLEAELLLDLQPATVFEGDVTAWQVTPWSDADLPGTQAPVSAAVSIWKPGTVQSANTTTVLGEDAEAGDFAPGSFAFEIVPGTSYQVAIVPTDPTIPFHTTDVSLTDDTAMSFDLGYGVAVWGTVVDGTGTPMKGVGVHAVDTLGLVSGASAFTDEAGRYLLRVESGLAYRIVCEGRASGREPQMSQGPFEITEVGLGVDFVYPNTVGWSASGRIVDADARPIENIEVVFRAVSLDGYPAGTEFDDAVVTNANGYFDTTRLLAGSYRVEVRPRAQHEFTPVVVEEVRVDEEVEDLGTLTLASLVVVDGQIVDESGEIVPGAVLIFTEVGFGGRIWQAAADENGAFFVSVPRVPMEVTITPPHRREELAITRYVLDPAADLNPTLVAHEGVRVHGTIRTPGGGEAPYVIVEARDSQGRRWGTALTDDRGRFEMRVALTP